MKALSLIILLFSWKALACRPSVNYKAPTKEEIERLADLIVIVQVMTNTGDSERRITGKVLQTLKGKTESPVLARTTPSTCDPLGYEASPANFCLLYMKDGRTLGGVYGGHASKCDQKLENLRK